MSTFKINITGNIDNISSKEEAVFSDYNQNPFTTEPDIVLDMKCIHQSLDNLFHSYRNHRRYMPWYYVPVNDLIGELNGIRSNMVILSTIASYVERNEPRVKCYPLLSTIANTGEHVVRLDLIMDVPTLHKNSKFIYTTDLNY